MAGETELAGARCLADSEHRFLKEKHRGVEGEEENPPRWFTRAERGWGGRVTAAASRGSRQDPNSEGRVY